MVIQSVLQPGVEIRDFHSTIMDQELRLFVKLPLGYEDEEISYPVLFVLDANQNFPIYATLSVVYEKFVKPSQMIIIVGVGYKLNDNRSIALAQWGSWRTRDLTPSQNPSVEQGMQKRVDQVMGDEKIIVQTGKAGRFLEVLKQEIIPLIESNYRALNRERGLAGYSFGGLFTLYALLYTPETFTHYLAGSPSMWEQLFKDEDDYAVKHNDLPAKVYLSVGSLEEDTLESLKAFAERLEARAYPGLVLNTQILDNENHLTAMAPSTTHGLCWHYYPHLINGH